MVLRSAVVSFFLRTRTSSRPMTLSVPLSPLASSFLLSSSTSVCRHWYRDEEGAVSCRREVPRERIYRAASWIIRASTTHHHTHFLNEYKEIRRGKGYLFFFGATPSLVHSIPTFLWAIIFASSSAFHRLPPSLCRHLNIVPPQRSGECATAFVVHLPSVIGREDEGGEG